MSKFKGTVVGKALAKNKVVMYKTKTQLWIDKVKGNFSQALANEIIDS